MTAPVWQRVTLLDPDGGTLHLLGWARRDGDRWWVRFDDGSACSVAPEMITAFGEERPYPPVLGAAV